MKKIIYLVAGARPNFMKIAPIIRALQRKDGQFEYKLIHTGQHYDREMSDVFFEELRAYLSQITTWIAAAVATPSKPPKSWWLLRTSAKRKDRLACWLWVMSIQL